MLFILQKILQYTTDLQGCVIEVCEAANGPVENVCPSYVEIRRRATRAAYQFRLGTHNKIGRSPERA